MTEALAVTRKWGSSLGIVIPKETVDEVQLQDGEEVLFTIRKRLLAKDVWGIIPKSRKSLQKMKDEFRKGWE